MTTTKLYQQDVYIKEWDAAVTRCEQNDKGNMLVWLDRTAFFPEGGGQSCDLGTVNGFPVIGVYEDGDGAICHVIDCAFRTGEIERQHRIFGDTIDARRGKPTGGEMIAQLADILRWEG